MPQSSTARSGHESEKKKRGRKCGQLLIVSFIFPLTVCLFYLDSNKMDGIREYPVQKI